MLGGDDVTDSTPGASDLSVSTVLILSASTGFCSGVVWGSIVSFWTKNPGTSSFGTIGALISMVLLCRFFFLPPSFFMLAKALLRVDLGDGCTFGGAGLEPCAPENVEERLGFDWDELGLTDFTGVTG